MTAEILALLASNPAAGLRATAALMRERAEAATPGPWRWDQYREDLPYLVGRGGDPEVYAYDAEVIEPDHHGECGCRSACYLELRVRPADRDHIASWHPDVALAVAVLLEDAVWRFEGDQRHYDDELACGRYPMWAPTLNEAAIAVARVYLGHPWCSTCGDTGLVDWAPGQIRHTDGDQQPCPDCPAGEQEGQP